MVVLCVRDNVCMNGMRACECVQYDQPTHRLAVRTDRVTIREKEAAEKREEQLEAERKRQEELRKRESHRVSSVAPEIRNTEREREAGRE